MALEWKLSGQQALESSSGQRPRVDLSCRGILYKKCHRARLDHIGRPGHKPASSHLQISCGDGSAVSIHLRHGSRPSAAGGNWKISGSQYALSIP